jgi:hypothetical protein
MRWHSDSWETIRERKENWRDWFAWYPVRIGDRIVWLETIVRRGEFHSWPGDCYWTYEYNFKESQ